MSGTECEAWISLAAQQYDTLRDGSVARAYDGTHWTKQDGRWSTNGNAERLAAHDLLDKYGLQIAIVVK